MFEGRWGKVSSVLRLLNRWILMCIEGVMACLWETVLTETVKDRLHVLGFLAYILRELIKIQNTKVVGDKLLCLEWVRT